MMCAAMACISRCARSSGELVYKALAPASALYTSSPLERAHRDMHAMAAHIIAQPNYVEDSGRVQLGLKPLNPMYMI